MTVEGWAFESRGRPTGIVEHHVMDIQYREEEGKTSCLFDNSEARSNQKKGGCQSSQAPRGTRNKTPT